MIQSDDKRCNSLSSSTASEKVTENNQSIDTVSKLFSNLFKNSESACSANYKSLTSATLDEFLLSTSVDCPLKTLIDNSEKEKDEEKTLYNNVGESSILLVTPERNAIKKKSLLAASSETIILERNKTAQTPFSSKIPILHTRSDDGFSHLEDAKKNRNVGIKFVNSGSLKRICSNSKIPVSTKRPCARANRNPHFQPSLDSIFKQSNLSANVPKQTEKNCPGKYTHVKSKLAAYIHRPIKMECPQISRSISPMNRPVKNDSPLTNCSYMKRISSRTSLDTYSCDYKMPLPDFNYLDLAKSDDTSEHYQKIRKHFELAAEHSRIKSEKERIIADHQSVITKQQQLVLEHGEKANEHTMKAISLIFNRITERS